MKKCIPKTCKFAPNYLFEVTISFIKLKTKKELQE